MSLYAPRINVRYYPVPKIACTSLKRVFYQLIHGAPFEGSGLHLQYPSRRFEKEQLEEKQPGEIRIAVVRDPVERFVSAFRNRIHRHGDASRWKLRKLGIETKLKPYPDLNPFVDDLEAYQETSQSVLHHTEPMVRFLGPDPAFFDRIFWLSELPDLVSYLSELADEPVDLPHLQKDGINATVADLGAKQRAKLEHYYREDYAFLAQLDRR